jgi:hypothetical protein
MVCCSWRVVAMMLALASVAVQGQTVEAPLHEMADVAGVLFVGDVLRVHRVDGGGLASGVVEVEFHVDHAVRGCGVGGSFVLREWAGLWAGGEQRYRVGERLLMLLHAPNAAGMSSPVGGLDGAIPIRGVEGELAGAALGATTARPVEMVDLRWVGTRVVRTVSYAGAGVRADALEVRLVDAVVSGGASASVASQGASVDAVVGMLGEWERARAGR